MLQRRDRYSSPASAKSGRGPSFPPPAHKNLKQGWLKQIQSMITPGNFSVMFIFCISLYYIITTQWTGKRSPTPPLRIGIVSSALFQPKGEKHNSNIHELTLSSYSARHGYTWLHIQQLLNMSDVDPQLHHLAPHWHKWLYINRYLELFDWLLFLDADTYVLDQTRKIEEYINLAGPDIDLIVSDYGARVNIGAILIKNSPWSRDFLKIWWDQGEKYYGFDNGGFNHAMMIAGLPGQYNGECASSVNTDSKKDMLWYDDCFNSVLDKAGFPYCSRKLDHIWMIGTCPEEIIRPIHLWSNPHAPTYHQLACFRQGDFILHTMNPYEFFNKWNVSYPTVNEFYLENVGFDVFDSKNIKRESCW